MAIRRLGIAVGVLAFLLAVAPRAFAATITFTSASSASFVQGTGGQFDVSTETAGMANTATITMSPSTPEAGVSFDGTAGDGTGLLAVTSAAAPGVFTVTFTATDNGGADTGTQTFTLTIRSKVTTSVSPSSSTFTVGQPGTVTISTAGFTSTPTITHSGALPSGVTFTDNRNGKATIAGTPTAAGTFPLTITATHVAASDPDATTAFTLTVLPASSSTNGATCAILNANQAAARNFKRGERFFVRGVMPGAMHVDLLWNGGGPTVGADGVDSGGNYLVSGVIPANAGLGANTVVARGKMTNGTVTGTATCGLNVVTGGTAVSGTPTLPKTGTPTSVLIALGVTMVELGAGLLLYTDRRRAAPVIGPWIQRTINRLES